MHELKDFTCCQTLLMFKIFGVQKTVENVHKWNVPERRILGAGVFAFSKMEKINEMVLLTSFNHEAQGLPLPTVFSHGSVPAVQMPGSMPNDSQPQQTWGNLADVHQRYSTTPVAL